jgi:hypothetical protein
MTNEIEKLPVMLSRAMTTLEQAKDAGEILEAKAMASAAYDAGKIAERFAKMKQAHGDVIAAIRKTQADALVIEARAQCRLADEYDAAQERGEVKGHGNKKKSDIPNENITSTVIDIGLTSKQVHEARAVRDAEKARPGIVRKTLDAQLAQGKEPTRAEVKRAMKPKAKSSPLPKQTDRHRKMIELNDGGESPADIAARTREACRRGCNRSRDVVGERATEIRRRDPCRKAQARYVIRGAGCRRGSQED